MKNLLILLCLAATPALFAQSVSLIDFQQPPGGPVEPGTLNHEILQFSLYRNTGSPPTNATQVRVAFAGTVTTADWVAVELWHDVDNSGDISGGDTQLASTSVTSAGKATFSGLSQPVPEGFSNSRNYLVIVDIDAAATIDRTFIFSMDDTDVTVSGGTVSTPFGAVGSNTHTVRIDTGTEIDVQRNSVSIPSSTTLQHHVGYVDVGADTRTFTILNTGTANLELTGSPLVEVTFTNNCAVTLTSPPTTPVVTSTTFTIEINPVTATAFNFTLRIANSDFDEHPYIIQCAGSASPIPEISIEYNSTHVPSGNTIDLGSQAAGVNVNMNFNIVNDGNANLVLTATPPVELALQQNVNCTLSTAPTTPIAQGGGNSGFTISLAPIGQGSWTFIARVYSNDPAIPTYSIFVEGTAPAVTATQLSVTRQPGNALATVAFGTQPIVAVTDGNGGVDLMDNSTVVIASLTTGTGDPTATLSGTLTATCINGYATFNSLRLDKEANGYTLTFTRQGGGLTPATSNSFNVGPEPSGGGGGGGGGGGSDDGGGGCSTGAPGLPWLMLCALIAGLALFLRVPRYRPGR